MIMQLPPLLRLMAVAATLVASAGAAPPPEVVFSDDFEATADQSPPANWVMWGAEQWKTPANYTRDTASPHRGQGCFRIHKPAGTRGYVVSSPARAVRPRRGTIIEVRFWARAAHAGSASFGLTAYESIAPFRDAPSPGFWPLPVTTEWREYQFAVREGLDFFAERAAHLLLTLNASTRADEEQTLWVDDVQVTSQTNPQATRLVDEATLKCDLVPARLVPGERLDCTVDVATVERPATPAAGGISFHRVSGWTGEPYDRDGRYTLKPATEAALKDLRLPLTRFYGVGHERYPVTESLDKIAELARRIDVPLASIVLELEEQSANRKLEPEEWAKALRHARQRGYGFRYFEVANEPYSSTWGIQMGRAFPTAESYADHVKAVATALRAVDPQVQVGIAIGDGAKWGNYVLQRAAGAYDYVVPHYYAGFGSGATRRFEAVTVGDNQRILERIQRVGALIRAYNPGRAVYQLDTEWGRHSSGAAGQVADDVWRNANSWGMLHRAVRLIYYAREGVLRGASSWQMFSAIRSPGFGILTGQAPDKRFLMYWLYHQFNRHVGEQVIAISGSAPYWQAAAGEDPQIRPGTYGGPLTPLLATRGADGKSVLLVVANASLSRQIPATVTLKGAAPREVQATLLRQDDPEANPLVDQAADVLRALSVTTEGNRLRFDLPGHSVAFVRLRVE